MMHIEEILLDIITEEGIQQRETSRSIYRDRDRDIYIYGDDVRIGQSLNMVHPIYTYMGCCPSGQCFSTKRSTGPP